MTALAAARARAESAGAPSARQRRVRARHANASARPGRTSPPAITRRPHRPATRRRVCSRRRPSKRSVVRRPAPPRSRRPRARRRPRRPRRSARRRSVPGRDCPCRRRRLRRPGRAAAPSPPPRRAADAERRTPDPQEGIRRTLRAVHGRARGAQPSRAEAGLAGAWRRTGAGHQAPSSRTRGRSASRSSHRASRCPATRPPSWPRGTTPSRRWTATSCAAMRAARSSCGRRTAGWIDRIGAVRRGALSAVLHQPCTSVVHVPVSLCARTTSVSGLALTAWVGNSRCRRGAADRRRPASSPRCSKTFSARRGLVVNSEQVLPDGTHALGALQ